MPDIVVIYAPSVKANKYIGVGLSVRPPAPVRPPVARILLSRSSAGDVRRRQKRRKERHARLGIALLLAVQLLKRRRRKCDMGASLTRNKKKIWNNKGGIRRLGGPAARPLERATVDRRRIV